MMIKHILTICAAMAGSVAVSSLAHAQGYPQAYPQGYPSAPGSIYSAPPAAAYPSADGRRPADFDALDEDDSPDARNSAALPPPGTAPQGPVLSPDDPRYGRPMAPVYSDRAASPAQPTGPILSPDDPRYGRVDGPPVIYGDRPSAPSPTVYSGQGGNDDRIPGTGIVYPPSDDRALRPPEGIGANGPGAVTGAVQAPQQPPMSGDGRPMTLASLPPDEQPDVAPTTLPPNLRRQEVSFATKEPAGTIVVDTPNTYLYYVLGGGRAVRYGVRVGRDGFTWTGVQKITRKAEWPDWHPPSEMIDRQPYLPRFMAGGPGNPLGARAMYLGATVYRIHGTNQPSTIGKFVSSGCIGMLNEDVSDLFDRVKVGTRVVVMPGGPPPGTATASAAPTVPAAGAAPAPVSPVTGPTVVPPLPAPVTVR